MKSGNVLTRLHAELKRRGVLTVIIPYLVVAWLCIEVTSVVAPILLLPDWVASIVFVIAVSAFPVAFYISWFFEWTDTGVHRTPDRAEVEMQSLTKRHWTGLLLTLSLAIFLGVLSYNYIKPEGPSDNDYPSENKLINLGLPTTKILGLDKEYHYLGSAINNELVEYLGHQEQLQVMTPVADSDISLPMTSAPSFTLLTSLSGKGQSLTYDVTLTNSNLEPRWTKTYEFTLADVYIMKEKLASDIYAQVANGKPLSNIIQHQPKSQAYNLYLKAIAHNPDSTDCLETLEQLSSAISISPAYAPPYAARATCRLSLLEVSASDTERAAQRRQIQNDIDKALLLVTNLASNYVALAKLHEINGAFDDAIAALDKAIQLNPSLKAAYLHKANALDALGKDEEAFATRESASHLHLLHSAN